MCAMSFQGGGQQGSSSVLQDSQDFLRQMWRQVQNLPALPGKWRQNLHRNGLQTGNLTVAHLLSMVCHYLCVETWQAICSSQWIWRTDSGCGQAGPFLLCNVFNTTDHNFSRHGNIFELLLNDISASFVGDKIHQSVLNSFSGGRPNGPSVSVRADRPKMGTFGWF